MGEVSQHLQIFAVFSRTITGSTAIELMCRSILQSSELGLAKASFAISFYTFREAAKTDIYEEVWDVLIQ